MTRKSLWGIAALLITALALPAFAGIDDQQFDAACRITAGSNMGTGSVYDLNSSYAAILTNAHVVDRANIVACEFWSRGHQSGKLPGQVFVSDPTIDAAVILVPAAAFGGVLPKPLAFAKSNPAIGALIKSVGCASGAWATGWEGHVTRYEGGQVYFVPPPAGGRSGSAICNEAGQIVGLLRIRTGDNKEGGAVELGTLLSRLTPATKTAAKDFTRDPQLTSWISACPPGGCPVPETDDGLFPIFPRRQQAAPPISGNPWPTLPSPSLMPPAIDYGPELNHIADLLQQRQAPPTPAAPAGPDPACMAAVQQVSGQVAQQGQQISALTGSVQAQGQQISQLASGLGEVAKQTKDIGDNVAKHGTLLERFSANKEAEAEKNPSESKAQQDIAALKDSLAFNNHGIAFTLGTLGVVGLILFFVLHTIPQWVQAASQKATAVAAANPGNAADQANAAFLNGLNQFNQAVTAIPNAINTALQTGLAATLPGVGPVAAGVTAATAAAHAASGAVQAVQSQVNTLAQNAHATALATPAPSQTAPTTAATTPASAASPVTVQLGSGTVAAAPAAAH